MPIEIDAIIAQMEWAAARGLSTFAVNVSGACIQIRRDASFVAPTTSRPAGSFASSAPVAAPIKDSAAPTIDAQTIDAPMAGLCHLAGDSDSAVFVSVGDEIEVGQTICMIEAMKVMTAVTATKSGTVKAILVEDGASVDAGAALFEVQS